MKQYLVSENDIKKALKIKDFRNISKEKIVEFFNLIPNMDKDVAKAVVNQFQSYKDLADTSIVAMKEMCNFALEKNDSSQKEVLLAYRKIIDSLADLLKRDDLTKEERRSFGSNGYNR